MSFISARRSILESLPASVPSPPASDTAALRAVSAHSPPAASPPRVGPRLLAPRYPPATARPLGPFSPKGFRCFPTARTISSLAVAFWLKPFSPKGSSGLAVAGTSLRPQGARPAYSCGSLGQHEGARRSPDGRFSECPRPSSLWRCSRSSVLCGRRPSPG